MDYSHPQVAEAAATLQSRFQQLPDKADVLKAPELRTLYGVIPTLASDQRASFGQEVNALKQQLEEWVAGSATEASQKSAIDVTAPFDHNVPADQRPSLLPAEYGSVHPLMRERQVIVDIFTRMGFGVSESREIDDDYHMFTALNFPADHPARDDYDTFMTQETDASGARFIAPAHTSTMQHRILAQHADSLAQGNPIAYVIPDRVFRNEDLDARHEHTFYQLEGIYVSRGVHAGHLMATLKAFLKDYYQKDIAIKTQPFYFPFTEPSFEFAAGCPFCEQQGCKVCGEGWIELGGCGMIHPNVLRDAGIDPTVYTGFAWGFGIERMAMIKHDIEDVRHFQSAKLDFLRQFA